MGKLQQASLLGLCAPPPPPRPEQAPKRMAVARAEAEREIPWIEQPERLVDTPSIRDINTGTASSSLLCLVRDDGLLDQVIVLQRLGGASRSISAPALMLVERQPGQPGRVDVCTFLTMVQAIMCARTGRHYVGHFVTQGPYGRSEPVPGVELGVADWRAKPKEVSNA